MIPDVSREQIIDALIRFDRELRHTTEWVDCEQQGNQVQHTGWRFLL